MMEENDVKSQALCRRWYKILRTREQDLILLVGNHEENQWLLFFLGKDIKVRNRSERMTKFLVWTDNIIKQSLSTQPFAAVHWLAPWNRHDAAGGCARDDFISICHLQLFSSFYKQNLDSLRARDASATLLSLKQQQKVQKQHACQLEEMTRSQELLAGIRHILEEGYKDNQNFNPQRLRGTRRWFSEDDKCTVCYFFFKYGNERHMSGAAAFSATLHQFFTHDRSHDLLRNSLKLHEGYGRSLRDIFSQLGRLREEYSLEFGLERRLADLPSKMSAAYEVDSLDC
ncbi:nacht and ankyrin domain protein [Colletotrichum chrysophilum]|uniref:Nacht and ankyrin domain protein n=1 Tax=Colletotrichum chrysophilum TaxID=1836956 RepID=A0AAD9EC51_9PEZI|nr:nacht and ankyrin domain protein [Colletotrichum chrysophilum]